MSLDSLLYAVFNDALDDIHDIALVSMVSCFKFQQIFGLHRIIGKGTLWQWSSRDLVARAGNW